MEESSVEIKGSRVYIPDSEEKNDNNTINEEVDAHCFKNPNTTNERVYYPQTTEKYAINYKMDHKSRGLALIFNHEQFDYLNLEERVGADEDRKNLEKVLQELGFKVRVFQDLKFYEIELEIEKAANYNHNDCDCLCICVLTHGSSEWFRAKDTYYKPDILWHRFSADRCLSLAGKPKMFFLQAWQEDKLEGGIEYDSNKREEDYSIPNQADFLVVTSIVKASSCTTLGSIFVRALCEELRTKAFETDLIKIFAYVLQRVELESDDSDSSQTQQPKQIPCVMSMLTRFIQFTAVKNGSDESE